MTSPQQWNSLGVQQFYMGEKMQRNAMGHFTGKAGGKGKADGQKGKGGKVYKGSFGPSNEPFKSKGKAKGKKGSKAWDGDFSERGWKDQYKQWKQLRASVWGETPSYANGKGGEQDYWEEWPEAQSSRKGGKGWNGFLLGARKKREKAKVVENGGTLQQRKIRHQTKKIC